MEMREKIWIIKPKSILWGAINNNHDWVKTHMASIQDQRPLSPHLQIYRPQITSAMSILHRLTGVALSVGTLVLLAWLCAAAYSADYYTFWTNQFTSWYGRVLLIGWSFALFYHLGNGVRHLFWDVVMGFDLRNVTRSGVFVLFFASGMTAVCWYCILNSI